MSGNETRAGAGIRAGEIVLPAAKLDETLAFFTERLGFRVAAVFPADAPSVVVICGHGLRVRLERERDGAPGVLRLLCDDPSALADGAHELTAPNGTRVELATWNVPLQLPALRPSFVLTRLGEGSGWGTGRAGMRYRDLIPDRQGGRFIASHIRVPEAGPVPDYVHRHRVRFQLIYCYRGWVRVVYEDQGSPFVLEAGDAVLQPPEIRHRVLESSAGLEVIEVSCPAEHETLADLELELPTPLARPERDFGGQRFVRHQTSRADWTPWRVPGFEARDLGIAAATRGLAGAQVVRWRGRASGPSGADQPLATHDAELLFSFVLEGAATLDSGAHGQERVSAGDSFVIPAGRTHALRECSSDLELLEVVLPAGVMSVALRPALE
jgi:quercetin dioxygenase-like cupin family protein